MPHQRLGETLEGGLQAGLAASNQAMFHSARFYSINSDWYFSVRECKDKGPYQSKEDAERAFKDFVGLLNEPGFVAKSRVKH
ncbi:MAG: hypothetical protein COB51_02225 [Moraxellaceae bacterium]|nr:MAG: hypothetical protein COB51_02225 [Moraxellaceae bacterium]